MVDKQGSDEGKQQQALEGNWNSRAAKAGSGHG